MNHISQMVFILSSGEQDMQSRTHHNMKAECKGSRNAAKHSFLCQLTFFSSAKILDPNFVTKPTISEVGFSGLNRYYCTTGTYFFFIEHERMKSEFDLIVIWTRVVGTAETSLRILPRKPTILANLAILNSSKISVLHSTIIICKK